MIGPVPLRSRRGQNYCPPFTYVLSVAAFPSWHFTCFHCGTESTEPVAQACGTGKIQVIPCLSRCVLADCASSVVERRGRATPWLPRIFGPRGWIRACTEMRGSSAVRRRRLF